MAQVTAQPPRTDRRLYQAAAILFPLVVLAGFGRTYYLTPILGGRPSPSAVVHVHGALMAMWVTLFVVQVSLVSARKVRVHQRLGYSAIGLAVLILGVGTVTALKSAKYGSATAPRPPIPPLQFLAVPLFDLVMFVILFGAAIYYRRRAASHRALMLLTMLNFLPPALARVSTTAMQALGPLYFFGIPTVLGITALVVDARQHGRINRVLAAGLALLVASFAGRLALMGTPAWLAFAEWATSFV